MNGEFLGGFGKRKKLLEVFQKCLVWLFVSYGITPACGDGGNKFHESLLCVAGHVAANHVGHLDETGNRVDECSAASFVAGWLHVESAEVGPPCPQKCAEFSTASFGGGFGGFGPVGLVAILAEEMAEEKRDESASHSGSKVAEYIRNLFWHFLSGIGGAVVFLIGDRKPRKRRAL